MRPAPSRIGTISATLRISIALCITTTRPITGILANVVAGLVAARLLRRLWQDALPKARFVGGQILVAASAIAARYGFALCTIRQCRVGIIVAIGGDCRHLGRIGILRRLRIICRGGFVGVALPTRCDRRQQSGYGCQRQRMPQAAVLPCIAKSLFHRSLKNTVQEPQFGNGRMCAQSERWAQKRPRPHRYKRQTVFFAKK